MNPLQRTGSCRVNDLVLKYAPAPRLLIPVRGDFRGRMGARGEACVVVQWLLRGGLMRRKVTSTLRADAGAALPV